MTVADESWKDAAACKGLSTDLFFPERGERVDQACDVCDTCPVQLECLTFALDSGERYGIWGGLSENQRRRMRRGRPRRIECANCFTTFIHVPTIGGGNFPLFCSPECRREKRLAGQRDSNRRREQDRRAHAHRERLRSTGDVNLDVLEGGAA